MVSASLRDRRTSIDRHQTATVTDVDHIRHVVDDHDDGGTTSRSFRTDLLTWHSVLGPSLSHLNQIDKASLTLFETADDSFVRELREVLILNDKVMKIVPQVVCTGSPTVAVENAEETDLRPFHIHVLLALGLEDVQDDRDTIFVVISDDALVGVGCVALYQSTLFLRSFGRLVIFQKERFGIEHRWVFTEKQSLNLDKLNVTILGILAGQARVTRCGVCVLGLSVSVLGLNRLLVRWCG